jgi:ribosomal protein L9
MPHKKDKETSIQGPIKKSRSVAGALRNKGSRLAYLDKDGKIVPAKKGTTSKLRKDLRSLQMRENEAKDKGLTQKEMLDLYGKEWMDKKAGPNIKHYGTKNQTEGYYEPEKKDVPSFNVKRSKKKNK